MKNQTYAGHPEKGDRFFMSLPC